MYDEHKSAYPCVKLLFLLVNMLNLAVMLYTAVLLLSQVKKKMKVP